MANEGEQHAQIARVGLKLPPLWKNNIKLWFVQVESNFQIAGITQDVTKYNALIASIDPESLSAVSDILYNAPVEQKYDTLKQRLISEFSDSENRQIRKLLSELQLGDEKPSHLLRKMRQLANNSLNDDFLKNLWFQRLPAEIQTILSVSSESLDNLAKLADKIAEVRSDPLGISLIGHGACSRPIPEAQSKENSGTQLTEIAALKLEISALGKQVERLSRQIFRTPFSKRRNSKSPFRHGSGNRQNFANNYSNSDYCFYHNRFGKNARNCKSPCSFHKTSESQGN